MYLNFMSKYKPEVTKVEECTNAEMGVGAAIAIGSQGEKGKIALLVMNVRTRKQTINKLGSKLEKT